MMHFPQGPTSWQKGGDTCTPFFPAADLGTQAALQQKEAAFSNLTRMPSVKMNALGGSRGLSECLNGVGWAIAVQLKSSHCLSLLGVLSHRGTGLLGQSMLHKYSRGIVFIQIGGLVCSEATAESEHIS